MSEPDPDEKIDATFRNGSLTAAGIILGFSLNFISVWVSNPNDWSRIDIPPMLFLTIGIAVQVKVFADLLARDSLFAVKYDRSRLALPDWIGNRRRRNRHCPDQRYSRARKDADARVKVFAPC